MGAGQQSRFLMTRQKGCLNLSSREKASLLSPMMDGMSPEGERVCVTGLVLHSGICLIDSTEAGRKAQS